MNASEVLVHHGAGKDVELVGYFPFIFRLRKAVRNLGVIGQHPTGDGFSAESASDPVLRADVAALTAAAKVNHTLNRLLALCSLEALVMWGHAPPFRRCCSITGQPSSPVHVFLMRPLCSIASGRVRHSRRLQVCACWCSRSHFRLQSDNQERQEMYEVQIKISASGVKLKKPVPVDNAESFTCVPI